MFSLIEKYRAWRLGRFLRMWEKKHAKGRGHYVAGFALFWCLFMTGSFTLVTLIFDEPIDIAMITVRLILGFLGGLLIGWFAWLSNEKVFFASSASEEQSSVYYPWGKEQEEDPEKFDADWKRDWQSMPHRDVVDLTNLNKVKADLIGTDFGQIISATISLAPEKYISGLYIQDEICPLCLESTVSSERLAGSLSLTFEKIDNIGSCIWVHKQCFESLPLRDDLPRFPA
ncbi:MAG: hypothetical protein ABL984_06805 [Pyrinomonadaceae bacterium]